MNWTSKTYANRWGELEDFYQPNLNNNMPVNSTDVTLMSLAMADFTAATAQLVAHDYYVAGGLAVIGVVLVYLYHKFGSTTTS